MDRAGQSVRSYMHEQNLEIIMTDIPPILHGKKNRADRTNLTMLDCASEDLKEFRLLHYHVFFNDRLRLQWT